MPDSIRTEPSVFSELVASAKEAKANRRILKFAWCLILYQSYIYCIGVGICIGAKKEGVSYWISVLAVLLVVGFTLFQKQKREIPPDETSVFDR